MVPSMEDGGVGGHPTGQPRVTATATENRPEEKLPDPEEKLPDPEENLPDPEENLPDPEENLPDPEENLLQGRCGGGTT
ncbi:unnamed protein product [Arctogadus glacialis]